ncbi:SidA/IucD/PvdA family monooxygenase [Bacillus sp. SM2101]|uniref:lysine N(6)-hydroxylase/L-ornithine N(5)-oxygenase family protein n=1 Tax=Bacillus sp. SM2101 TaxID=2805366 RepID=UPI001BDED5AB
MEEVVMKEEVNEIIDNMPVVDIAGIGFGPSNLALAIALEESDSNFYSVFFEGKDHFAWHPNMLIDGMQLQVSFIKDLVTLRNPQSYFSFINYLKVQNRLNDFINLRDFYPTRLEYNDYFRWAAGHFANQVHYGTKVSRIEPYGEEKNHRIKYIKMTTENLKTGDVTEFLAKNIIVATGGKPNIPEHLEINSDKVIHSNQFLYKLKENYPDTNKPYRFVVVGSGQSAAEIFYYLMNHYKNAHVTAAFKNYAYRQTDDSPFVNELYHHSMVDFLNNLTSEQRSSFLDEHQNTNYAVVDAQLIKDIYKMIYIQKLSGSNRCEIKPFMDLKNIVEKGEDLAGEFLNMKNELEEISADGIFLATGYQRKIPSLIDGITEYMEKDEKGQVKVDRDHKLVVKDSLSPSIYVQGFNEQNNGLSDTLLSILPFRAGEILKSLQLNNFVE